MQTRTFENNSATYDVRVSIGHSRPVCNARTTRYFVLYLKDGIEYQTPSFFSRDRADKALKILQRQGRKGVVYVD